MDVDESIAQLGQNLASWWAGSSPVLDSRDRIAQGNALLRGFEIANDFDRLKTDGLAAITALLDRHDAAADDERITSLIRSFEFGARLADTLHDKFGTPRTERPRWCGSRRAARSSQHWRAGFGCGLPC